MATLSSGTATAAATNTTSTSTYTSTSTPTTPLSATISKYAKFAYEQQRITDQHVVESSLQDFLERLNHPDSSSPLPIPVDTSHPIAHYFISSSHNTYLSGNQLWSKSSGDSYKDVLKRGCRCIEVDVWDGDSPSSSEVEDNGKAPREDGDVKKLSGMLKRKLGKLRSRKDAAKQEPDSPAADQNPMPTPWRTASGQLEPLVYHGYTATKEMPFRKVCEVVREYAFRTTDMPLIVSLEVHCSPSQQEVMVDLMNDYWGACLVRKPDDFSDATPLPSLEDLKKKILVKVKYSPPEKARKAEATVTSQKADDTSSDDEDTEAVAKGKIIEKLSNMGVFTRAFHFHNFEQPEASIPTHIFSLGESKLLAACEEHPDKVLKHNMHHLMRAYPKGTRLRSSNLDPAPFWRFGLQIVALNFQKLDAAMMLNSAQFEGTGGWVLKPAGYLPVEGQQPVPERKTLDLSVKLHAAQGLGLADDAPTVYVKCELHVESKAEAENNQIPKGGKNKGGELKLQSTARRGHDPDFGSELLRFERVRGVIPALAFLRFKVLDDVSFQKDPLLGWACYRLDRLRQGLVLLHLRGEDSKLTGGKVLVEMHAKWDADTTTY